MKRKLRKPLSWLLTVAMIFSLFCGMIPTASAASGSSGESLFTFEYSDGGITGKLTIVLQDEKGNQLDTFVAQDYQKGWVGTNVLTVNNDYVITDISHETGTITRLVYGETGCSFAYTFIGDESTLYVTVREFEKPDVDEWIDTRETIEYRIYDMQLLKMLYLAGVEDVDIDTEIEDVKFQFIRDYIDEEWDFGYNLPAGNALGYHFASLSDVSGNGNPYNIESIVITYDGEKTATIPAKDLMYDQSAYHQYEIKANAQGANETHAVTFYTQPGVLEEYYPYALRFVPNGKSFAEAGVEMPEAPTYGGEYIFTNWSYNPDGDEPFSSTTKITADTNLYARRTTSSLGGSEIHVLNENGSFVDRLLELYSANLGVSLAEDQIDLNSMKITVYGQDEDGNIKKTNPNYDNGSTKCEWKDDYGYFLVVNYNVAGDNPTLSNTHIPHDEMFKVEVSATVNGTPNQTVEIPVGLNAGNLLLSLENQEYMIELVVNQAPDVPTDDDITVDPNKPGDTGLLGTNAVKVTCTNDEATHTDIEKTYGLLPGTYTVPTNEDVYWANDADGNGAYYVKVTNIVPDQYVAAYNGSGNNHRLHPKTQEKGTIVLKLVNNQWEVDSGAPVEFTVTCADESGDEVPNPPTKDDLDKLLGEDAVLIHCTSAEYDHDEVTYALKEGYTFGSVTGGNGTYAVTMNVYAEPYVAAYKPDGKTHSLNVGETDPETISFTWTEEDGWQVASAIPVVFTVTCKGDAWFNPTEFHIMHLNDIKQAVANAADLESAEDVEIYTIYVQGTHNPNWVEGVFGEDPKAAQATGGIDTFEGNADVGVTGFNGMLAGNDWGIFEELGIERDAWKVLNADDIIDDNTVTGITIYYKVSGDNTERFVEIPCTEFASIERLEGIFGLSRHITQIWLDVESDEPVEPDPTIPPKPDEEDIPGSDGILAGAIRLDCSTNGHDAVTCNVAENTTGQKDSYKIGEVEGNAETGYTCDITVYPVESYLKDYNTTYSNTYSGHTYDPDSQFDTITLVWNPTGGQDGKSAWTVKDGKYALFAVKCSLVENAPEPTYDQLKDLIDVQVVCLNTQAGHEAEQYDLIDGTYTAVVTGNSAVVKVASSAYVELYNDLDKGVAPGHSTVADQTIQLTWDTEKQTWYVNTGDGTVTFNVTCSGSEKYIITATAGENGSITPEGKVTVDAEAQQDFTFTPNDGYAVDTVYVSNNGENKTFVNNGTKQLLSWEGYSFPKVTSDGYITVTFAEDHDGDGIPDKYEYTLTYDANGGYFGENKDQSLKQQPVTAGEYELTEKPTHAAVSLENKGAVNVEFVGWTLNKEAAQAKIYQAGDTTVPTTIPSVEVKDGDVTVFAVWGYDEDGDGTADVNELVITPADITIYTGGTGYLGVTTNEDGDIVSNEALASGLPEPGYHIDLPANIQTWLGNGTTAENLATILHFEYNVEEGAAAGTRNWEMKYAGVYATDASGNPLRYVYTLEPSDDGNGKKIPVRILYKDGDTIVDDDKIDMSATAAHEEYTMTINPGELDQNKIQAKLTKGGESKTLNVFIGTGKLTIRSVVEKEDNTSVIAANESSVTGNEIAAVGNNASYVVNDSEVSIDVTNNADRVRLLVDKVSDSEEFDEAMEDASLTHAEMSDGACETAYLDLVDTENGNTVVTLGRGSMDIYWPMPENADAEGIFKVVHYVGMDRESTASEESLDQQTVEVLQGDKLSVESIGGQQYIKFSTDSFSPFALVYETKDPGTGPDTDPDDDKDDDDHYTGGGGNDNDSDPTGNLSIELDVNGGDDEFTFTVYFTDEDGDDLRNNFYYNGDYTGTIGSGDEITLEGGDKIVIRNLPEGTRYEVIIETADGYTYVIDGEEGIIRTGTNEAEFTATRTVPLADPSVTGVSRWLNVTDHIAYLTGYPGGAFGPDNSMTRAEVAQMFYALLNNKNVTITKTFPDVPANAWYATAVNTLASLGMVSGDANGNYRPNDPITRAEFCVIALAFAYEPDNAVCYFSDVSRSDWFYPYVAQAASYGWIGGYTNGAFGPNDPITRAQVTTIVNNMLGRAADRDYVIDHQADLVQFTDLNRTYWGYYQIMEATNAHDYTKSNGTENWR